MEAVEEEEDDDEVDCSSSPTGLGRNDRAALMSDFIVLIVRRSDSSLSLVEEETKYGALLAEV